MAHYVTLEFLSSAFNGEYFHNVDANPNKGVVYVTPDMGPPNPNLTPRK